MKRAERSKIVYLFWFCLFQVHSSTTNKQTKIIRNESPKKNFTDLKFE